MASRTTFIPRFLLPQFGLMWRTTLRSATFVRPLNAEVGQVMVRYASKAAAAAKARKNSAPTKPLPKTTAGKVSATKPRTTPQKPTSPITSGTPMSTTITAKTPTSPITSGTRVSTTITAKAPTSPITSGTRGSTTITAKTPASPIASETPVSSTITETTTSTKPIVEAVASSETTPTTTIQPAAVAVDPSQPIVLEKPERFNPPSHGARLPRSMPKHYGGPMSTEEVQAQEQKFYPGLPPPKQSWAHWFIYSPAIHLLISLSVLFVLGAWTFVLNFRATCPFLYMIPHWTEFFFHPVNYLTILLRVAILAKEHDSALVAEKRLFKVDELAKRNAYRKHHGMDAANKSWLNPIEKEEEERERKRVAAAFAEAEAAAEAGVSSSGAKLSH